MVESLRITQGQIDTTNRHYGIRVEIKTENGTMTIFHFDSWFAGVERGKFFINGYQENRGLEVSSDTITFEHLRDGDADEEITFNISGSTLFNKLSEWGGNKKSQNEPIQPFEWSTLTDATDLQTKRVARRGGRRLVVVERLVGFRPPASPEHTCPS